MSIARGRSVGSTRRGRANFRTYDGAVRWLDTLQGSGIRPGLARMRALLRAAGNPHRACPTVIIAGTNGKGSTSATLDSILNESGLRAGLYTSPHLVDLRERWRVAGSDATPGMLLRATNELHAASDLSGIVPTYFEALTLLAFIVFRDAGCELAVLEVGMGGRLDATNVTRPLAALISPIALDHREFLGNTIEEIAWEKAGVIQEGCVALTSSRDPVALGVIRRRVDEVGSHLIETARDCDVESLRSTRDGLAFRLETPHETYELRTPLRGRHQVDNVALAVRGAEMLQWQLASITKESIERGVRNARWRGRLERFDLAHGAVWVDGGHNEDAIRAILPFVRNSIPHPRCLVFGIMKDKDYEPVAKLLYPHFDRLILTRPEPSRGADPVALAALSTLERKLIAVRSSPKDAVALALKEQWPSTLVCGSLYLAGEAIALLDKRVAPK